MKLLTFAISLGLLGLSYETGADGESARTSKGLYANSKIVDNRNLFSPRMDYDEWTPLGRGDPLKNDPTYDYVPPVLERVHYWMDPSKRTPDPPVLNSGVLLLGSSRTEPTFTMRVTTPKYSKVEPQADSRLDTMSLLDPFLKLMDVSKFGLNLNPSTNSNYYAKPTPNANRRPVHHQQYNGQRYQQPQALQRPPYTMLMPPPPPPSQTASPTFATVTTTTETSKTPETTAFQTTTIGTTTKPNPESNITTIYPTTIFANTENVYRPVAISVDNETIRGDIEDMKNSISDGKKHESEHPKTKRPVQEQYNELKSKEPQKFRPTSKIQPSLGMTPPPKSVKISEKHANKWGIETRATTTKPATTTRMTNTLTTDPMFKHYKQPSEPIKGPFYLIIQGHSKVKTYGASKNPINGLLTSNEIKEDVGDRKYGDFQEGKRKRGKSLGWYPHSSNILREEGKLQRKKKFDPEDDFLDVKTPAISQLSVFQGGLEHLEDTFGKSEGGTSKKRYLANDMMNETEDKFSYDAPARSSRQLLSLKDSFTSAPTMLTLPGSSTRSSDKTSTTPSDNLDIESFIALNDDYAAEDIVSLLLKEEGQGSGFGNFVASIFGKSLQEEENEMR